jgi:hypothetical protein
MTHQEAQKLKALLVATAMYYNHPLPDEALKLYVEDLADLPFEEVAQAIGEIRRDPNNRRCPLPALVRARLRPAHDPETLAKMVAGKILEAIARIGPYRVAEAREHVGEVGWQVVEWSGGWENLCQIGNDDLGMHRAQWRELAKAAAIEQRQATAPALAAPKNTAGALTQFDLGSLLPKPVPAGRTIRDRTGEVVSGESDE